jgi:hypothetical protein
MDDFESRGAKLHKSIELAAKFEYQTHEVLAPKCAIHLSESEGLSCGAATGTYVNTEIVQRPREDSEHRHRSNTPPFLHFQK